MERRNQVFQRLKPRCVSLSQTALALRDPKGSVQAVAQDLAALKDTLSSIAEVPDSLDEKLADYVFFPLSQVLKASQKASVRCLEVSLQCLSILISEGWRARLQPQLAGQVLILCTLMAEKTPERSAVPSSTNELRESAFRCIGAIFAVIPPSSDTRRALVAESNITQLGQTISVILDGINEGETIELQTSAISALHALVRNVATTEIQASFLPGIVSVLTKVLGAQAERRRHPRVLSESLEVLTLLLHGTLSDDRETSTVATAVSKVGSTSDVDIRNEQWLDTTAMQLRPALATIMRLKSHGKESVRDKLADLCLVILQECRKSLANCILLALDTLLAVASWDASGDSVKLQLCRLLQNHSDLQVQLQQSVYNKLQSLATTMQSSDTTLKTQGLQQLIVAYSILTESGTDVAMLDKTLAITLRESVVITLLPTRSDTKKASLLSSNHSLSIATSATIRESTDFSPALIQHRGQEDVMRSIEQLAQVIGQSESSDVFRADLARSLYRSHGDVQIATFWLLLTSTKNAVELRSTSVDEFVTLDSQPPEPYREYLETLYSFALDVLANSSEDSEDTRLKSLSLRAVALYAQVAKLEFRYELIDALYPVLHSLATPNDTLQHDSTVTLNVFASACGYRSVKDLIVENVDYLTNAVALKLNAFDVSPQAPQVLLMMVKLAGPALLPHLEDTIESIFAALEDYHGYSLLVELLFRVLSVVVEEGIKEPRLASTDAKSLPWVQSHRLAPESLTIATLAVELEQLAAENASNSEQVDVGNRSHPRRPWKADEINDNDEDEDSDRVQDLETTSDQEAQPGDVEAPPPAPKTYSILLKITELTQHFLPSASPSLKTSLLALIRKSVPSIAQHENSFLPLVNTLWPEIVSRLNDKEPNIIADALDVIGALCQYAGDFMRSRILQLWPHLMEIYRDHIEVPVGALGPNTALPSKALGPQRLSARTHPNHALLPVQRLTVSMYSDTSTRLVRQAYTNAIAAIVRHVDASPEIFDEALNTLLPMLGDEAVHSAFEAENADALWLARIRAGLVPIPSMPAGVSEKGWKFATVS